MNSVLQSLIHAEPVVFFSKTDCPFCDKLADDLEAMVVPFKKVMLNEIDLKDDLVSLTACNTVPQLFIGGQFVGGYKEFSSLCGLGKIAALLKPFHIDPVLDF